MPMIRLGGGAPAATASNSTSSAVGALPINSRGVGCVVASSAQARDIPRAERVDPGGAWVGAQSNRQCTDEPSVRRAIGATAAAAIAVSVTIAAPC